MARQADDGSQDAARSRNDTIIMAGHAFDALLPQAFKKFESDLASGDDAREFRAATTLLGLMTTWQSDLARAEAERNRTQAALLRARKAYLRSSKAVAEAETMPDFVFEGDGGAEEEAS